MNKKDYDNWYRETHREEIRENNHRYYQRNRDKIRARSKARYERIKGTDIVKGYGRRTRARRKQRWLDIIAAEFPKLACSQCGFNEAFSALDFHHLDPSIKEHGIADIINRFAPSNKRIVELRKCILLCRNCHSMLHSGDIALRDER